jgi:hypothetical protein
MIKHFQRLIIPSIVLFFSGTVLGIGKTVVFLEKNFPSIENSPISRTVLERAFSPLHARYVNLSDLKKNDVLAEGDLLILPYGSAFPADAWETILHHLRNGHLLVLGGRPLFVPVYQKGNKWQIDSPQNTYARSVNIEHSYEAPQHGPWKIQWDEDAPWFDHSTVDARRVFVNAGFGGGRYRGVGFFIDAQGNRLSAPVVAEDLIDHRQSLRRRVYLSFESDTEFWNSVQGIDLMRKSALYASLGGCRIWLNLQQLTINPGESISGSVDVLRNGKPASIALKIISGSQILAQRTTTCGNALLENINLSVPSTKPGLYKVRASLSIGDTLFEQYTSGIFVRDSALLRSGDHLEAHRDYFRLGGKPYLMAGANYFGTDPYTPGFFYGGSLGGNAWVWEKDFGEMEQLGITTVRTGIWLNRASYLSWVNGAPENRLLDAIEAYLSAAGRHHMQVIFTFFAFDPQTEMQGHGQDGSRLGPGSNPYLDPDALEAQLQYLRAIVERFRDVPFLSYDLINEPSFCNPKRIWRGNSPNGDPKELAAWQQWLENKYKSIENLARAWHTPADELGTFNGLTLPAFADLDFSRFGNPHIIRAVDYNLFAQDSFIQWINTIVNAIRSTGSQQIITVGQDEGGVADRVLNQFWANSQVDYTGNHTWWRDDALLWSSVAAKSPNKPNIIGETGPQLVSSMDGSLRWDDVHGSPLLERKLALSFANANAGVLHWDWTRTDNFGLLRRDGSNKQWMEILRGITNFAREAQPYATEARLPDIAIVLPQSLQLSTFGGWGLTVQQNAVRALYHYSRATAFVTGEYQLSKMPEAKFIIVPAPWILSQDAWDLLMNKVRAGATLLLSGRIDADEHWLPVPERTQNWNVDYKPVSLTTREALLKWDGDSAHLTYSGDKPTYAERGVLNNEKTFLEFTLGKGRILYFSLPLELADQLNEIGRIYNYAMKRAGVTISYETACKDPGILICPTQLPEATLYVLTSESADAARVAFRDKLSGKDFCVDLAPGRAALLLINKGGQIVASYNTHGK